MSQLANLAVLIAGVAVALFGSGLPDIAVAGMIAVLGLSAAFRVTRRAIGELRLPQASAAE